MQNAQCLWRPLSRGTSIARRIERASRRVTNSEARHRAPAYADGGPAPAYDAATRAYSERSSAISRA